MIVFHSQPVNSEKPLFNEILDPSSGQPFFDRKFLLEKAIRDEHTIFVVTGILEENQVKQAISAVIEEIKQEHTLISENFRCNLVTTRDGALLGYGFVWFEDSTIYYLLTGRTEEGFVINGAIEIVETESHNYETLMLKLKEFDDTPLSGSWADCAEEEEEIYCKYGPIEVYHEPVPLFNIPDIKYTEQQRRYLRKLAVSCNYQGDIPDRFTLIVKPATINDHFGDTSNVIFSPSIPPEVTIDDLHYIFDCLSTSTDLSYPKIVIARNRYCTITFDPNTHDTSFALLLHKKVAVRKNGKTLMLLFNPLLANNARR